MNSEGDNGLAFRAIKPSARSAHLASPQRAIAHLAIPPDSPLSRRASPRVEDMLRPSPRKAQRTRQRLVRYHTFDHAADLIKASRNIVVLTGAGISTSVGIPDFRSDKGLYNKLSKIGITQPEDFFSMTYFQENPEDFFRYVQDIIPFAVPAVDATYKPVKPVSSRGTAPKSASCTVPQFTPTHAFLALLQAKGKLLTNYTQNIDGLERAAGLAPDQYVQCHGSWDTATCLTCGRKSSAKKYLPVVHSGNVPHCKCLNEPQVARASVKRKQAKSRIGQKRKRANSFSDHSSDDGTKPVEPPRSLLKPDLVFFEEKITPLYHTRLESDRPQVDLLIIMGTSLKVAPIQNMLFKIRPDVPQIYISRERFSGALCSLPGVQVDIELLGECDVIIEELCRRAGWASALEKWLWEKGQTKIKTISDLTKTQLLVGEAMRMVKPSQDVQTGSDREELSHTTDETETSTRNEYIETKIKKEDLSTIGAAIPKDTAKSSFMRAVNTTSTSTSQSTGTSTTEPKLSRTLPAPEHESKQESKVKIELVEGTDHQWRVTRRKRMNK